MLTGLHLQEFKSWRDTGSVKLSPITGIFGTNGSGKTSLFQALLLLKQTAEYSDRSKVLNFGDKTTPVDLGDYIKVIHRQDYFRSLSISIRWRSEYYPYALDSYFKGKMLVNSSFFLNLFFAENLNQKLKRCGIELLGKRSEWLRIFGALGRSNLRNLCEVMIAITSFLMNRKNLAQFLHPAV